MKSIADYQSLVMQLHTTISDINVDLLEHVRQLIIRVEGEVRQVMFQPFP